MSNEELVELIRQGETDRMPALWEQIRGWVAKLSLKWLRAFSGQCGVELDDLISCGYLAMAGAVETFTTGKENSFIGWLTFYLKKEFTTLYGVKTNRQRQDPINHAVSLSTPLPGTDDMTLEDTVPDGSDQYEDIERRIYLEQLHEALEAALNTMPEALSDTLRRRFYDGQTLAEISEEVHINPENVRMRESKALRKLREPRIRKTLRPFLYPDADIYAAGLRRGYSTEAAAIRMIEGEAL